MNIKLNKGQYLQEVEPFKSSGIPSDCILYKIIPGCGITTSEMKYTQRNSIIILPNVPVIEGKVKEHNEENDAKHQVLEVYKGFNEDDIAEYLSSPAVFKKILITPEGFNDKLVPYFENKWEEFINGFFLLYDECEKIIKDVGYREQIAIPADVFFQFKNKAMVSATVLPFSDKRFDAFDRYVIEPQYSYSKAIKLIETNNVLESLKGYLASLDSEHVSIFINSTDTILAIINSLKIEAISRVYCAPESVHKLKVAGYSNARYTLDVKDLAKYNFFTSRYFSAVDIKVDYKPDVILVTDLTMASFTALDPLTDVIQISGRFRKGINSLAHISNFNPSMEVQKPEEIGPYLEGCFKTYEGFVKGLQVATSKGETDTLNGAIEGSHVHKFYINGLRNSFMIDNYFHEQRVKGYYLSFSNLLNAYKQRPDHFDVTHSQETYAEGDYEKLSRKKLSGKKLLNLVAHKIHSLTPGGESLYVIGGEEHLAYLWRTYPLVAKAYRVLGIEALDATGYRISTINKEVKKAEEKALLKEMSPDVYKAFKDSEAAVPPDSIPTTLNKIYDKHGYKPRKEGAIQSDILKFYVGKRTTRDDKKVYSLTGRLFDSVSE